MSESGWISVAERLPKKGEFVLVCFKDETFRGDRGMMVVRARIGREYRGPFNNPDITHWMPLPDPPKEG